MLFQARHLVAPVSLSASGWGAAVHPNQNTLLYIVQQCIDQAGKGDMLEVAAKGDMLEVLLCYTTTTH